MRIALIADTFPPMRTSGAVQLRDLSRELVRQGHEITVVLPSAQVKAAWTLEESEGLKVLRLRAPRTKDVSYVRRTFGELLMPFSMLRNLRRSPVRHQRWDGVVWYAPSIFLGPVAASIKRASDCRAYLILRDIFPEWALDMQLLKPGLIYQFFRAIARYQYSVADTVGVQSPGNVAFLGSAAGCLGKVEVLANWLSDEPDTACSIQLSHTQLAGRRIFVYAGNMGIAQGIDVFLDLAESMLDRSDIGFLFVGRGTDSARLEAEAHRRKLSNTVFSHEVAPEEIPSLYAQCHVGLVALDPRHKTHNIPGKFLSYMRSGLPVLAVVNSGNDLITLIEREGVGRVNVSRDVQQLRQDADEILTVVRTDAGIRNRCRALFINMFSPETVTAQIIASLTRGVIAPKSIARVSSDDVRTAQVQAGSYTRS